MSTSGVSNTNTNQSYNYSQLNPASSGTSTANPDTTVAGLTANFLKLLTTQLQNQDPLNPIDNAQMTTQLAQLNMVQGINTLNSTMQTLLSNASNDQYMQAGLLVGHSVLINGSNINLTTPSSSGGGGRGVAFGVNLAANAATVNVVIKDSSGNVVRTMHLGSMDAGTSNVAWDGLKDDGSKAPDGAYSASFAATNTSGAAVSATALQVSMNLSTPTGSGATRGAAFGVNLASAADTVTATIKDKNGVTVRTYNLGKMSAGTTSLAWDGMKDDGTAAADGSYTVSFTATQGGDKVTATALQLAGVIGALKTATGIQLDLGSQGKVGLSDIYQII